MKIQVNQLRKLIREEIENNDYNQHMEILDRTLFYHFNDLQDLAQQLSDQKMSLGNVAIKQLSKLYLQKPQQIFQTLIDNGMPSPISNDDMIGRTYHQDEKITKFVQNGRDGHGNLVKRYLTTDNRIVSIHVGNQNNKAFPE